MRLPASLSALLLPLLAACSAEPADPPPAPVATGTPTGPQAMAVIPQPWQGVWDWSEGSCDPASDLRMEIGPNAIRFHESEGRVVKAELVGVTLAVDLAMSGEGEEWQQRSMLTLADGGAVLETGAPAPDGDGRLRYRRCETAPG